jgi:hypothetical protein
MATARTSVNPRKWLEAKKRRSVPRPLVLHRPAHIRAELPRGGQRPVRIAEELAGEDDHVRLLRAQDMLCLECLADRIRSANGVW